MLEKLFNNACATAVTLVAIFVPIFLVSGLLDHIGFHWIAIVTAWVVLTLALLIMAHKLGWRSVPIERQVKCQDCHKEGKMAVAGGVPYCITCGQMHIEPSDEP